MSNVSSKTDYSSPERRLTRLAYGMGFERASVGPCGRTWSVDSCVSALALSNMNVSATKRLITAKFYQQHHWCGVKAALGPDRIGTLVSMATDSSHRVLMGGILLAL